MGPRLAPAKDADSAQDGEVASDGGMAPEAGVKLCAPTGRFGVPRPILGVNTPASEVAATLSNDELTIFFSRRVSAATDPARLQLFSAKRSSRAAAFEAPAPLPWSSGLTSAFVGVGDFVPSLWKDNKTLYVSTLDPTERLYVVDLTAPPATRSAVEYVSTPGVTTAPNNSWINPWPYGDDKVLFAVAGPAAGEGVIVSAGLRAANEFLSPSPVPGLHIAGSGDFRPILRNGHLYFGSNRNRLDGGLGNDSYDVLVATTDGITFQVEPVPALASNAKGELLSWVSPDECRIYFASKVDGAYDLFVVERSP